MRLRLIHCLLLFITLPALAQTPKQELHFKSSKQQLITVYKGTIFVNGNRAYQMPADSIIYKSRRNRLLEDKGNVFLFLDVKGSTDNELYVFAINNSRADSLLTAISSNIRDMDHDGFPEFGGRASVPAYPSADSMYYTPSRYYEIKKGRIGLDAAYTEKMEKRINGVYIPDPLDGNGHCCKVIPKRS